MRVTYARRAALLGLALVAVSCGSAVRQGTGTSYLIINALEGASGAEPDEFGATLHSDVVTLVESVPTTFNDMGRVRFTLGLKDPGSSSSPNSPTPNQYITIDRYRVRYVRADGRNTPGVDVPYGFDGSFTATVGVGSTEAAFQIVRHIAKQEAPLGALRNGAVIISTIGEVTFFGRDQTGHEVTVTGRLSIDFGHFSDPG